MKTTWSRCLLGVLSSTLLYGCAEDDDADAQPITDSGTGSGTGASDGEEDHASHGEEEGSSATSEPGGDPSAGSDDSSGAGMRSTLECADQMILDLGLVEGAVSSGAVVDTARADVWSSNVDATAGGLAEAPNNPWLYLRFTSDGLRKVDIDDFEALESTQWDIAAKRFGLRLNGGVSGPSSVEAAALSDATFDDVTSVPEGVSWAQETFYDASCNLIDDGSGQGAPGYLLTPWWSYPGCVATTGVPFVLALPERGVVKFVVDAYYESGQQSCNADGTMGMGSAMYTWRWAFLE